MPLEGFELDESRAANEVSEHVSAWFKSVPTHRFCTEPFHKI